MTNKTEYPFSPTLPAKPMLGTPRNPKESQGTPRNPKELQGTPGAQGTQKNPKEP